MNVGIYIGKIPSTYDFVFSTVSKMLEMPSGHTFTIFLERKEDESRFSLSNSNVVILPRKKSIGRFVKNTLDDLLVLHEVDVLYLTSEYVDYEISIPFIFTIWDVAHRMTPYFPEVSTVNNGQQWFIRESIYQHYLPRASFVITGTNQGREEMEKLYGIPSPRVKIIPFPSPELKDSNLSADFSILPKSLEGKYLFLPASLHPHKNHITAIRALRILHERYGLKLTLIFTGDGPNRAYLEEEVEKINLKNFVLFLGFLEREKIEFLYENAFALVFPTLIGPDNLPPLEAFALGCPVIASDIPGAREQLGEASILFNSLSEDDLASKIQYLFSNSEKRKELIKRGKEHAVSNSVWCYAQALIQLFDEFSKIRRTWGVKNPYQNKKISLKQKIFSWFLC